MTYCGVSINKVTLMKSSHLEPPTPSCNEVAGWDADVLIYDLAVSLWGIIISEDLHGTDDFDSRRICRNNNDALA